MKKLYLALGVIGFCLCRMVPTHTKPTPEQRDFSFYRTMVFQNGHTREVYASVIVYIEDYDIEEMFDRIRYEHDLMNESPDKLTIWLYDSKEALKAGERKGEKVYRIE